VTVLDVSDLTKDYGATRALRGVSLSVRPGEVLGIVGQNGAGKSTLIKILSGAVRQTAGTIHIGGTPAAFAEPRDARAAGIQTVHQHIAEGVVAGHSVAENLVLDAYAPAADAARGATAVQAWQRNWVTPKRTRALARTLAEAAHLDVDLDAPVESLTASQRQHVIIARALARRPRLLILDEPTAALPANEADELVTTIRRLAGAGVAVLYVSHRLSEIDSLCDRVVVFRDGTVARTFKAPFETRELVEAMLGAAEHGAGAMAFPFTGRTPGSPILEAEGVCSFRGSSPFSLVVRSGEVVGITGLIGAGKTELLEQLFGARPLVSGALRLGGSPYAPKSPRDAIAAGVGFVAEERGAQATVPGWSLRSHVSLPALRSVSRFGLLSKGQEEALTQRVIDAFGVKSPGPSAAIETLSGGNQQKALVGRWFSQPPKKLVLLDEPFRGVDVGARASIALQLRALAVSTGVLLASSDPQEVTQVADRILVMREGTLAGELPAGDASPGRIAELMAGGGSREDDSLQGGAA
jgi:simple sugar transport system ATP-binding protein